MPLQYLALLLLCTLPVLTLPAQGPRGLPSGRREHTAYCWARQYRCARPITAAGAVLRLCFRLPAAQKFSDWPTFPQLYAGGELLGGADIVNAMADAGDLKPALDLAIASVQPSGGAVFQCGSRLCGGLRPLYGGASCLQPELRIRLQPLAPDPAARQPCFRSMGSGCHPHVYPHALLTHDVKRVPQPWTQQHLSHCSALGRWFGDRFGPCQQRFRGRSKQHRGGDGCRRRQRRSGRSGRGAAEAAGGADRGAPCHAVHEGCVVHRDNFYAMSEFRFEYLITPFFMARWPKGRQSSMRRVVGLRVPVNCASHFCGSQLPFRPSHGHTSHLNELACRS